MGLPWKEMEDGKRNDGKIERDHGLWFDLVDHVCGFNNTKWKKCIEGKSPEVETNPSGKMCDDEKNALP